MTAQVEKFTIYISKKYNSLVDAKQDVESNLRECITKQISNAPFYIRKAISGNASFGYSFSNELNELIADASVLMKRGDLTDPVLMRLIKEIVS